MRKLYLLSMLVYLSISLQAQTEYTTGNVYDYEIGDLFQYISWSPYGGTNTQKEIIDKYYSLSLDTVFYVCHLLKINSDEYGLSYENYVDTAFYTNLSSLINSGGTVSYSTTDCDDSFIQFYSIPVYDWFPTSTKRYAIGLGGILTEYVYNNGDEANTELEYYDKGDSTCGSYNPIFETMDINQVNHQGSFSIYPNPTDDYVVIAYEALQFSESIEIYNLSGQLVRQIDIRPMTSTFRLDISDFERGICLVKIGNLTQKLIVQ